MAHSARTWKGARTPQALKRDRQAARRHEINQPRESRAKTLVAKALKAAIAGDTELTTATLPEAESALDLAAKTGAIHPNAAARRKSRLMHKVNAALAGVAVVGTARATKTTGRAAAAKAAKARVAASRATKAKGEQTAAGKARAAVHRATRGEGTAEAAPRVESTAETAAPKKARARAAKPAEGAAKTPRTRTTKAAAAAKPAEAPEKPARTPRAKKQPEA